MRNTTLNINKPPATRPTRIVSPLAIGYTPYAVFVTTLLVLSMASFVRAQEPGRLALLPFENISGSVNSIRIIMPLVEQTLAAKGYRIVSPEKIEPFLLRHRIRRTGMLSRKHLSQMRQEFGVEVALVGSVNLFYESDDNPQWGVSSRIISTADGRVLWAESTGRTGGDYTGLLGLGTITSGSLLAREVVRILFQTLPSSGSPFSAPREQRTRKFRLFGVRGGYRSPMLESAPQWRVAVTTFENLSERSGAGRILVDVLTTALFQHGRFEVADPGEVNEALITLRRIPYGGLDLATLRALKEQTGVDAIFLGAVYRYNEGLKRQASTSPEIALDIRLLHAESGKTLWFEAAERSGDEYQIALDFGIIRPMVPLIKKTMREMLETL